MNDNKCVYTALIGDYEQLNEQHVAKSSNIDFICFTDNRNITSKTWNIEYINPIFPLDNIRSAREIKIATHRYLPKYQTSLYIDNSVTLKTTPEEIFNDLLTNHFDFYFITHSFRETVLDEFEEVLRINYDQQNTILEQLNAYSIIDPELFKQKPYWSGFLIRKHNKKEVINAMEDWLAQVLRYSRRDQLSLNYIIRKQNIKIKEFAFDNRSSKYHRWPTSTRYGKPSVEFSLNSIIENNLRAESLSKKLSLVVEHVEELEIELANLESANQALQTELDTQHRKYEIDLTNLESANQALQTELDTQLNNCEEEILFYALSKSWIVTRPLRKIGKFFKN